MTFGVVLFAISTVLASQGCYGGQTAATTPERPSDAFSSQDPIVTM